ncbi:MAG: radical SAM protein [Candidatus Omnitrophica bacterium]|nr:radical SAM protein [Candidatus Omnitrophota bacterium]
MTAYSRNNEINLKEELRKDIVLESMPRRVQVILTTKCNLRCIMCGRFSCDPSLTMPLDRVKKIYSLFPYLQIVDWQGGEVFILDYFKGLFLDVSGNFPHIMHNITTNALLIDNEWADVLAGSNVCLQCSIDSVTEPVYESIRVGGSFKALSRNLDLINEAKAARAGNVNLDLVAIVMKRNLKEMVLFPDFCRKYNFRSLRFSALWPDKAPEEDILSRPERDTFQYLNDALVQIKDKCRQYNINFHCTFDSLVRAHLEGGDKGGGQCGVPAEEGAKVRVIECRMPWTNLFINANGDVYPECKCQRPAGNIERDSLEEIWNNSTMQIYRSLIRWGGADKICSEQCKFRGSLYEKL